MLRIKNRIGKNRLANFLNLVCVSAYQMEDIFVLSVSLTYVGMSYVMILNYGTVRHQKMCQAQMIDMM